MKSEYAIVQEPRYGYFRLDPIPSAEEVDRFYREEFYASYKNFNDSSLEVQLEDQDFYFSRWESVAQRIEQHFGRREGLSLLDIGAGYGQALLYFRSAGLDVAGIEPTTEGVEYARSQGLTIYHTGIEDFDCVSDKRFDVVTIINVLEHLRDPVRILENVREKLLKKGGLLVLDIPNDFNDFQLVADTESDLGRWWIVPPVHINYFSATSLKRTLAGTGYSVIASESSFPLEIFLLFGDVYVGDPALGSACHKKRVKFEYLMRKHGKAKKMQQLYEKLAELDLGRQIVMYATPKL